MALNLVKLQDDLKNAPDQALVGYVQNPTGQVPTYLALSELERRKRMREGAQAQQGGGEQPSVAEQLVAESAPPPMEGVAALPVPDDMYSAAQGGIVGYADGGMVAFEGGGIVQRFTEGKEVLSLEEQLRRLQAQRRKDATARYWAEQERAGNERGVYGAVIGDMLNRVGDLPRALQRTLTGGILGGKPYEDQAPLAAQEYVDRNKKAQADAAAASISPQQVEQQPSRPEQENVTLPDGSVVNKAAFLRSQQGIATGKVAAPPAPPVAQPQPRAATAGAPQSLAALAYEPSQDLSAEYTVTPAASAETERARYMSMMGDDPYQAKAAERLAAMESRAAEEEAKAPWWALAFGGFEAAAGDSPYALQNIARGATKGAESFAKSRERAAAAEEKRFALESDLAAKQRAEQIAATTFGLNSEQTQQAREDRQNTEKRAYKASLASETATRSFEAKKFNLDYELKKEELKDTRDYRTKALSIQSQVGSKEYTVVESLAEQILEDSKDADGNTTMKRSEALEKAYNVRQGLGMRGENAQKAALVKALVTATDPEQIRLITEQLARLDRGESVGAPTQRYDPKKRALVTD